MSTTVSVTFADNLAEDHVSARSDRAPRPAQAS